MTFGENKKIFLSLVDEYAPDIDVKTEDEDILIKMIPLYAEAYQSMADIYTRMKTKEIQINKVNENYGYEKYSLPKCKKVKRVVALDENNNEIVADFKYLGENIYISNKKDAKYIIEYVPYLDILTENVTDDFELELDQDLVMFLPWKVAYALFMTDPGENYTAFLQEYQRKLNNLDTNRTGISVTINEGEFD